MRQRSALALLVAGSNFMLNLDGTIVTTALPTISADLHISTGESGLVVTSYLVALASCIPLAGWLQARVPARWLFTGAILVFTLASLGCSTATTLPVLAGWRIVQGIGGAMLLPMRRQLVLRDAPLAQIQTLIAYIVWPALVAPVVAPLVGGLIVEHWR